MHEDVVLFELTSNGLGDVPGDVLVALDRRLYLGDEEEEVYGARVEWFF
jgi:hypothetical protein